MASRCEGPVKTYLAGEALAVNRRVKLSAAKTVSYSDAGQDWIGVTEKAQATVGGQVPVRLRTAEGTQNIEASAAVADMAVVYGADDGKISTTINGKPVGVAHGAASGAGSIIEVLAQTDAATGLLQTAKADTVTLTIAELLTGVIDGTPTAAAGYTLPTAALLVAGLRNARVGESFRFLINNKSAGANTITVAAGVGGTADGTLTVAQNVIREFVVIVTNVTGGAEAYFVYGLCA